MLVLKLNTGSCEQKMYFSLKYGTHVEAWGGSLTLTECRKLWIHLVSRQLGSPNISKSSSQLISISDQLLFGSDNILAHKCDEAVLSQLH